MFGWGELVVQYDNYCEIDFSKVDEWGILVLCFYYKWRDYECWQACYMQDIFEEILINMGVKILFGKKIVVNDYGLNKLGEIIYEVGIVCMGDDLKIFVMNGYG